MPNGIAGLVARLGRLEHGVERPAIRLRRAPAGYIACTSMPACCFIRSMREHGPLIWLPTRAGTATQRPSDLRQILDGRFDLAVELDQLGHDVVDRLQAIGMVGGSQLGKAKMSWPDRACASAAMVSRFLLPCEVM